MSEFYPGQRVLCIDGQFHPSVWEYVNEVPLEGEVYTVAWIRARGRDNVTGKIGPALALSEISGSLPGGKSVVCWCTWRFSPLDVQKTAAVTRQKKGRPTKKEAVTKPRRLAPVKA
ncbi:MAG: hypothetical protein WEB31_07625 [Chthoniobacterales bacterium]